MDPSAGRGRRLTRMIRTLSEAQPTLASVSQMSETWSLKNPYPSKIVDNYILNGEGSRKETATSRSTSGILA